MLTEIAAFTADVARLTNVPMITTTKPVTNPTK